MAATQWWASSASDAASSVVGLGFEGFGDALVGALAAGGAELVVEAVLDQPVGEPIPVRGAALDEHRGVDRRVEEVQQRVHADVGEAGEEVDVELAADHRGEAQDAQGFVAEAFDASADDVADTGREAELFELAGEGPAAVVALDDPAGLAEVAEQLGGEERVPVGLAPHRVGEADPVVVEVVTRRGGEQLDELVVFEAAERDAGDVGFAVHVGQQLRERIAAGEVGVAEACRRSSRSSVSSKR